MQLNPVSPSEETLKVNGFWQVLQSTVPPLPIFFMVFFCSLKDLAEDLLIEEKSSLVIIES